MKGLKFFSRTNSRGTWNLASYHSPHSLTWRWIVSIDLPRRGEGRWRPGWYWSPHNSGGQAYFQILKVGIRLHWQRPMWYRDMYQRARDEADGYRYQRSTFNYAAEQTEVADGGKSLH
jgi:hypothetical protein